MYYRRNSRKDTLLTALRGTRAFFEICITQNRAKRVARTIRVPEKGHLVCIEKAALKRVGKVHILALVYIKNSIDC